MSRKPDLTDDLMAWVGMTPKIRDTAQALERAGLRYNALQVRYASVEMNEHEVAEHERREAKLEAKILDLAGTLPNPFLTNPEREGRWDVRFEGAYCTVELRVIDPDTREVIARVDVDR